MTRKRIRPSQAGSKVSNVQPFSLREFFAEFPNDDACLMRVMEVRYGLHHVCAKCGKDSTFHKLAERRAFSCAHCGNHVYPCAETILQDSRTSLQSWFYAIYLFIVTRHGVSGKELQRALGVTYKTAWRMGQQIRKLMGSRMSSKFSKDMSNLMRLMSAAVTPANAGAAPKARRLSWVWPSAAERSRPK
jgi:hypothetical protein